MNKRSFIFTLAGIGIILTGCATAPEKPESKAVLSAEVNETMALFRAQYPAFETYRNTSYGYAVLPKVFKGAIWIGGAYGRGEVYEQGQMVGYCDMKQATLGFSFGGEFFREVIFFNDKAALDRFRSGQFAFSAQATAVAAETGVAAKTDYKDGLAVFVMTDAGLMVDASLGGQKFKYLPK
ncbi:MAG: lipid-binding SYLF domain-containing protein [Sedimentisphaerales bacterium]|nr:lipid-binding SYLF domain-containing protein [Sedimentisphaerales bacterium]